MIDADIFVVIAKRRSTRRFRDTPVEDHKIQKLMAAAYTAPTAGNFQGFEIFHVKDPAKEALAAACNNQKYVNAPVVLVFCKNPRRVVLQGKIQYFSRLVKRHIAIGILVLSAYHYARAGIPPNRYD